PAVFIATTHHIHGLGVTLITGADEPQNRGTLVPVHAITFEQHATKPELSRCHTVFGGAVHPKGGLGRVTREQHLQLAVTHPLQSSQPFLGGLKSRGARELLWRQHYSSAHRRNRL